MAFLRQSWEYIKLGLDALDQQISDGVGLDGDTINMDATRSLISKVDLVVRLGIIGNLVPGVQPTLPELNLNSFSLTIRDLASKKVSTIDSAAYSDEISFDECKALVTTKHYSGKVLVYSLWRLISIILNKCSKAKPSSLDPSQAYYKLLCSTLLTRYWGAIYTGSLQVGYGPLTVEEIDYDIKPRDQIQFKKYLVELLDKADEFRVIEELFYILQSQESKRPPWLNKVGSHQLTLQLIKPNGIRRMVSFIASQGQLTGSQLDKLTSTLLNPPHYPQMDNNYFKQLTNQLLTTLGEPEVEGNLLNLTSYLLGQSLLHDPIQSKFYIIDPIMKPFRQFLGKHIASPESYSLIKLRRFSTEGNPTWERLDRLVTPYLPCLFELYCTIQPTNLDFKIIMNDILMSYFQLAPDNQTIIFNLMRIVNSSLATNAPLVEFKLSGLSFTIISREKPELNLLSQFRVFLQNPGYHLNLAKFLEFAEMLCDSKSVLFDRMDILGALLLRYSSRSNNPLDSNSDIMISQMLIMTMDKFQSHLIRPDQNYIKLIETIIGLITKFYKDFIHQPQGDDNDDAGEKTSIMELLINLLSTILDHNYQLVTSDQLFLDQLVPILDELIQQHNEKSSMLSLMAIRRCKSIKLLLGSNVIKPNNKGKELGNLAINIDPHQRFSQAKVYLKDSILPLRVNGVLIIEELIVNYPKLVAPELADLIYDELNNLLISEETDQDPYLYNPIIRVQARLIGMITQPVEYGLSRLLLNFNDLACGWENRIRIGELLHVIVSFKSIDLCLPETMAKLWGSLLLVLVGGDQSDEAIVLQGSSLAIISELVEGYPTNCLTHLPQLFPRLSHLIRFTKHVTLFRSTIILLYGILLGLGHDVVYFLGWEQVHHLSEELALAECISSSFDELANQHVAKCRDLLHKVINNDAQSPSNPLRIVQDATDNKRLKEIDLIPRAHPIFNIASMHKNKSPSIDIPASLKISPSKSHSLQVEEITTELDKLNWSKQ